MGTAQNLCVRVPGWWLELVASQLDPVTQRVAKVDRPHEAPINATGVGNATLVEAIGDLIVGRQADLKRDVVRRSDMIRHIASRDAVVGTEDRDQSPVARIEIEMADFRRIEIRLFENKWHPKDAFPEVDAGLAVRTIQGDVVYALGLYPSHLPPQSANC